MNQRIVAIAGIALAALCLIAAGLFALQYFPYTPNETDKLLCQFGNVSACDSYNNGVNWHQLMFAAMLGSGGLGVILLLVTLGVLVYLNRNN